MLGADEFQGWTWQGFHHHMAVVLLTQAFVASQRLVRVAAIQRLMEKHGLDRETAEEVGVDMLRGFFERG